MSRIGKMPIPVVDGVKVDLGSDVIKVVGPKGTLEQRLPEGISAAMKEQTIVVERKDDSKSQRALHGLSRSLLANAVTGVSKGFEKILEIHGVGYSADAKGRNVVFKLGYSHTIDFPLPKGIDVKIERNKMTVSGYDRQQVGQVAADIRALRKPDVYKQKGIRYADERLRKKAGKTGAK